MTTTANKTSNSHREELLNKTPKATNGSKTRQQARQAVGQNVASQTVNNFDDITCNELQTRSPRRANKSIFKPH